MHPRTKVMQSYEIFDMGNGPHGFNSVALRILRLRRTVENLPLQSGRDISGLSPKRTLAFEKKLRCVQNPLGNVS